MLSLIKLLNVIMCTIGAASYPWWHLLAVIGSRVAKGSGYLEMSGLIAS